MHPMETLIIAHGHAGAVRCGQDLRLRRADGAPGTRCALLVCAMVLLGAAGVELSEYHRQRSILPGLAPCGNGLAEHAGILRCPQHETLVEISLPLIPEDGLGSVARNGRQHLVVERADAAPARITVATLSE